MKMGYIIALAVFLHLSFYPALYAVEITNSPTPVLEGDNVTFVPHPNIAIVIAIWNFKSSPVVYFFNGIGTTSADFRSKVDFNSTDYSLTILSAQVADTGDYSFNVEPSYQEIFPLSVQVPVSNVSVTASALNVVEFQEVTLECSAQGSPLNFQWINNTKVVTANNRIQLNNDGRILIIEEVSQFDVGPFVCKVSTDINYNMSSPIVFNISYGPVNLTMEVSPNKMAYKAGSSVNLSCSAESVPAATYRWERNGAPLDDLGPLLKLNDIEASEAVEYTCLAHNHATSRRAEISRVLRIIEPITAVVVKEVAGPPILNRTFTLSCDVTGPPDTILWMMGGGYFNPQDHGADLSDKNKTLTFSSVDKLDNGAYTCMAINEVCDMTSTMYNLTVNYGPKMPAISGSPSIVATGTSVSLTCYADSMPPANYTWTAPDMNMVTGPVYRMNSVSKDKSGIYTCLASNDITGATDTATKELTVIDLITSATVWANKLPVNGKGFMLTCESDGTVYNWTWTMNGKPFTPNNHTHFSHNNKVLTFDPVMRSDDGKYTCMASNLLSNANSTVFNLEVNYGPMMPVISGPTHAVRTGYTVMLNCSADSMPQSNYTWYFGDANGEMKVKVGSQWMHTIENASPSDSGRYTCVATNDVTGNSSNASTQLEVIDPITAAKVEAVVWPPILGKMFELYCNVTGGPVYSVIWHKNSSVLHPNNRISFSDDNQTLTFNHLMHSDDGDYNCTASNPVSNHTSSEFNLKVFYGPEKMDIIAPSIVATGSNVSLTCSVASWPPSNVTWHFNGSDVAMTQVLMLPSVSPSDSGEYICTAHNDVTNIIESVNKTLTVINKIPAVMVKEADGLPVLNKMFALTCHVPVHVNSIHWMKDGQHLHQNDRISTSNDNMTLTFNTVEMSDDGNYTCFAMNAVSKKNSTEYHLLVNYGPWNTNITVPQVEPAGANVTLSCSAESHPPSVFTWSLNGSKMATEGPWLKLTNLTHADEGNYTCKAHNNVTGLSGSASAFLRVIRRLTEVKVSDDDQKPILGEMFSLTCIGNSEITSIYWMKDGMMLNSNSSVEFSEDNVTMTIAYLTHEDNGMYTCTAHNEVGEKTSPPYYLKVNFGPENVSISGPELAETGQIVVFNCSATSWPPSVFSWYFNGVLVANDSSHYTPDPLSLNDTGIYMCMAYNNVTDMNSSDSMAMRVLQTPVIELKPMPVIPMNDEDFSLFCDIEGPYDNIKWIRNSRLLVFNQSVTHVNDNTTVQFKPLTIANDGDYQCEVANALKRHLSEPYTLHASYGPSHVKIYMTAENPVTLECVAKSQPASTYEWRRDGKVVGDSSEISMSIIDALQSRNFTCQATNPLTKATVSATFYIPDIDAASPLQSRVDLTLTVVLALSLSLLGNWFY